MSEVRGDSRICIQDKTGQIRTVISEEDYERFGYKAKGWTVVTTDWTKDRKVRNPINAEKEMALASMASGERVSD